MQLDVLIFGGGVAGLWLLDELRRQGRRVLLLEADRIGSGQTIAAQGIIHGGLKYTLQGLLTPSASHIREMPIVWRECLAGVREPNLSRTRLRSESCYLWRTDSLSSRLGMIGARVGLRVAPTKIDEGDRPAILAHCPGVVARLDEQVIAVDSLLHAFLQRNRDHLLHMLPGEVDFQVAESGTIDRVTIRSRGERLALEPRQVLFAAGSGNADLRTAVGLSETAMQRRPLHMVMLRGDLPVINGHCVDGATTRVTITSDRDRMGRVVWQVGGQIAEVGVGLEPSEVIARCRAELLATIPGIRLDHVDWATYRVDRAEGRTSNGARPETVQILQEANVLTVWPTKLALAPLLASEVIARLPAAESRPPLEIYAGWPRPRVAELPWETASWTSDARTSDRKAA